MPPACARVPDDLAFWHRSMYPGENVVATKWLLALVVMVGAAMPGMAWAEKRIALVIGNAEYDGSLPPLENPVNDAKLIVGALKKVGFEVISVADASQKEMKRAINRFGAAIADGGADVTALFFYAGHGLQVNGTNYLVPVNAEIAQEGDVDIESVAADAILSQMEHAGAKTSIVILDACRNNPLSRGFRSASRGLARMETPNGSFLAYSTAPGDIAADGSGRNSPFARALAAEMVKPDQAIEETFRNVRIQVMQETNQRQTPWDSSSMLVPFYFAAPAAKAVASAPAAKAAANVPVAEPAAPAAQPAPASEPEPQIVAAVDPAPQPAPEPQQQPALPASKSADFVSPLPDGTIVISPEVKRDLDAYLAKMASLRPLRGKLKVGFFYVTTDGKYAGAYSCDAYREEDSDCPRADIAAQAPHKSRAMALKNCEVGGRDCVLLYRAEEQETAYKVFGE